MIKKIVKQFLCRLSIFTSRNIKLSLGSGGIHDSNWIPTDIDTLNVLDTNDWKRLLKNRSVSAIMSEHMWEHLTLEDGSIAAQNCFDYLSPNSILRIAVPDGFHPDPMYIQHVKVGGSGAGADDHKVLYTYKILVQLLKNIGFMITLLEYYDENGEFHFKEWSNENGLIRRSSRYDIRNKGGVLNYTSLIIDARKPQ